MFDELQTKLDSIFAGFRNLRIAVLGDIMFDKYLIGDSKRISPEAPVPVVYIREEKVRLGGSANVAANVKSIGKCRTVLFGIVGKDEEASKIKKMLEDIRIEYFIVEDEKRVTTQKTRVIARGHQIVRFDKEDTEKIPTNYEKLILKDFTKTRFDFVILSDYAKGFFTETLTNKIKEICAEKKTPILCDPKVENFHLFKGVDIVVPNIDEAENMVKTRINREKEEEIEMLCTKLSDQLLTKYTVITMGERGMVLCLDDHRFTHIPAVARSVYDVTGAGDTVSSSISLCLASRLDIKTACYFATVAAASKVQQLGTYAVTQENIRKMLQTISMVE